MLENEGTEYCRIAESWFSGHGYFGIMGGPEVMFPPVYPGLIGGLNVVIGNREIAGRCVSLVAGLTLVVVLYLLTKRVFGRPTAFVAGAFAALHPVLVALSVSVYSESLAICFVMLAALAVVYGADSDRSTRGSMLLAAAAGASIGLAHLVRPEMLVLVGVVCPAIVVGNWGRDEPRRRAFERGALALLTCVLVAAPYTAYLTRAAGHFRWEGKTGANELINERMRSGMSYDRASRGLDESDHFDERAPYLGGPDMWPDESPFLRGSGHASTRGPMDLLRAAPSRIGGVLHLVKGATNAWASIWRIRIGVIGSWIGLLLTKWWRGPGKLAGGVLIAFGAIQMSFLLGIMFLWDRYAFPLIPILIPWTSAGVVWVVARLVGLGRRGEGADAWVMPIATVIIGVTCLEALPSVAALEDFRQSTDRETKTEGQWIRDRWNERRPHAGYPVIMGYGAVLPFYAGAVLSYLPYVDDQGTALRYVHWKAPDYIVIRAKEIGKGPYFKSWLEGGIPDPCAEPVRQVTEPTGPLRIWRWTCRS
ncbi:MAG TPA: glycosyltransferase family 39 protein [Polyangiaceae bacterium]|nr:glycosyltransferase family 39 protein [Polyangiaceae bacterium]